MVFMMGWINKYGEPGNYGRIIQQDINADDYDGRTQQGLAFNSDTEAKAQSEWQIFALASSWAASMTTYSSNF